MQAVIDLLLNIDPMAYVILLGGGAGISLLTQWTKRLLSLTNEKHVIAVLNLFALLASGVEYFISASDLPPSILGVSTVMLTGVATTLYIYIIKPLTIFINSVNLYKNRVLEKVEAIEAVVPAEVIAEVPKPVVIIEEPKKEEELPVADF